MKTKTILTKSTPIVNDTRTVNLNQFIIAVHQLADFFKVDEGDIEVKTRFESYSDRFTFKAESSAFAFNVNFSSKGGKK